jgi:hypothetical protein
MKTIHIRRGRRHRHFFASAAGQARSIKFLAEIIPIPGSYAPIFRASRLATWPGKFERMRVLAMLVFALLVSGASCSDDSKPYHQRSYDAGFYDGWADTCNRIDRYKESMGKALKDAHIC